MLIGLAACEAGRLGGSETARWAWALVALAAPACSEWAPFRLPDDSRNGGADASWSGLDDEGQAGELGWDSGPGPED